MAEDYKPDQMFTNELNGHKGWPSPYAIDKAVTFDSSVTVDRIKPGRVAYIETSSGANPLFKLGTAQPSNTKAPMPFFLFQGGKDYDVVGDHGNIVGARMKTRSDYDNETGTARAARIMGLAACAGYELDTTEFITSGNTFDSGDFLVSSNDDNADEGKLTKANGGVAEMVCGVVSEGQVPHDHKNNTDGFLRFHSVYLPVIPAIYNTQA